MDNATGSLLVGSSAYMRNLRRECRLVAPESITVVIEGESGTGKYVVAQEIVRQARIQLRKDLPLVRISAAQVGDELLDATLFGHTDNAFTDARRQQVGLIKAAEGGTLFWDEGQESSRKAQQRLLDILEGKPLRMLGETRDFVVQTRVLFGVQYPLRELVRKNVIRRDLAARLNVWTIRLRPLREHREDVPALACMMLAELAGRHRKELPTVTPEAMQLMLQHNWPDNIRQLQTALERALIKACWANGSNPVIRLESLEPELLEAPKRRTRRIEAGPSEIAGALQIAKGNVTRAAVNLELSRKTLQRRLKEYGIDSALIRRRKPSAVVSDIELMREASRGARA